MNSLQNSELVTNSEGCVYHLNLKPEHIADTIILVGDPNRVSFVSSYFDSIEVQRSNREMITHTGYIGKKRISVISTGMGTDNIDIVLTELDVLANFNLDTKTLNEKHKLLNIIRIGTCGALQADILLNSIILTHYVVGLDGLLYFYDCPDSIFEKDLETSFISHVGWGEKLPGIYSVKSSDSLEKLFTDNNIIRGITISAPGFYGPQGRAIHLSLKYPQLNNLAESFYFNGYKVVNYEMESSAIYGLGKALGHNVLTLTLVAANRVTGEFCSDYCAAMRGLIEQVLSEVEKML